MSDLLQEITASELSNWMKTGKKFTIMDVRETWELKLVHLDDPRLINLPTSQISRLLKTAFPPEIRDPESEIVVMCHHGVRSANVTMWMTKNGWKNVRSLAGGIDSYATEIDPSVGKY